VDLKAQVSQTIDRYELLPVGDTVVVGVSGGVDSLCLLALLCELAPAYGVTLHVGHLNHLLRPEAAGEAITVRSLCEHWSLPCSVGALDVRSLASTEKLTLEEAARLGRYRYLGGLARQVGATSVAVGHHADDQAETVVMHLLRGAGLAGLRGMRPLALLDEGQSDRDQEAPGASHRIRLIRPLLSITRAQLEAYASERGFAPAIDALNNDRRYLRNRVRHELLPVLQTYNPQIRASLCRTAEALAGDFELLQSAVEEAWDRTVRQSDSARVVFHRRRLWAETQASQRALIRQGVQVLRGSTKELSWKQVAGAVEIVRNGSVGAQAEMPGGLVLTMGYDDVVLARGIAPWTAASLPRIQCELTLTVPGAQTLPDSEWRVVSELLSRSSPPVDYRQRVGPYHAWLDADRLEGPVRMRPRRSGDLLRPVGMGGSQTVKELMINCKVPAHERSTVPILVSGRDELVWVAGLRIDGRFTVGEETTHVLHVWFEPCSPGEEGR
jgi:tRNA(Ile)-lysidine synthetase-like protein